MTREPLGSASVSPRTLRPAPLDDKSVRSTHPAPPSAPSPPSESRHPAAAADSLPPLSEPGSLAGPAAAGLGLASGRRGAAPAPAPACARAQASSSRSLASAWWHRSIRVSSPSRRSVWAARPAICSARTRRGHAHGDALPSLHARHPAPRAAVSSKQAGLSVAHGREVSHVVGGHAGRKPLPAPGSHPPQAHACPRLTPAPVPYLAQVLDDDAERL